MAFVPTLPFLLTMACDSSEMNDTTTDPVETTEASDEDPEPVKEETVDAAPEEDNEDTSTTDDVAEEETVEHDELFFTENIMLNYNELIDEEHGVIPVVAITVSASDLEHRLSHSFQSSDTTQDHITEHLTNVEIDDNNVIHFTFPEDFPDGSISMASTESLVFTNMLHVISDGFGAKQMNFYAGDELGVMINPLDELSEVPVVLDDGVGYYRPSISLDSDYENPLIPTRSTDHTILSDDFEEVLHELQAFEGGAYYESPIPDVIELHDAWIEDDGKAQLHYSITDESEWDEEQQQAFEYAVFLTALDFNATNARLVDEGNQEILDFPLLEDRDPHANQPEH